MIATRHDGGGGEERDGGAPKRERAGKSGQTNGSHGVSSRTRMPPFSRGCHWWIGCFVFRENT
jgi:hypothetical protein